MPDEIVGMNSIVREYLQLAVRRRWWLLATACGVTVAVALGSLGLPNRYTSEATILVVQQQVPERYVVPNTTYSVREALDSLTQAVLSRDRLSQMITEFNLYPGDARRLGEDGLVGLMRKDIELTPIQKDVNEKDINAFKIAFTTTDPVTAQRVTERLTSFFIQENLKLQEQQDVGTTSFLKDQLASAEADLKQQEERVRDFKMSNLGELPEQEQENLGILAGLHGQLQNTISELTHTQEQRTYLRSLLDQYRNLDGFRVSIADSGATPDPLVAAQQELQRLETQRAALLSRFSPQYPDVVDIESQIARQKALLASLKLPADSKSDSASTADSSAPPESGSEAQVKSQLAANQLQIDDLTKTQHRLEKDIAEYERRLNLTPVRQQQLSDILRGYDLAKKNYDDLLGNVKQSEMATNLAQRQQGQQFRMVDQPSLPGKPSSPERGKIALGGAVAGILLGAALAFLIDSSYHCFRSEEALRTAFKFPLILGLPLTRTAVEERELSRRRYTEWATATTLVMVALAAEAFVYLKG
jgi:polysaccharide chain length determinant protein (PEP-CTERM system associated)